MEAKRITDILEKNPDAAVPYSCVGCVYVHLSQFDIALEYFQKSREIREMVIKKQK